MIAIKQQIRHFWNEIPPLVRTFLIRALVLFVVWQTVYINFLSQRRLIDKPLTNFIAESTVFILSKSYNQSKFSILPVTIKEVSNNRVLEFTKTNILMNEKKIIGIADNCNGLSVIILSLGFILSFPTLQQKKQKAFHCFFIVALICVINILRICVLSYMSINKSAYIDLAHHYIFNMVVYTIISIYFLKYVYR